MGDWKGFERLAERIAVTWPDATVTWDDHLPGRLTKTSDRSTCRSGGPTPTRVPDHGAGQGLGHPCRREGDRRLRPVIKDVDATHGVTVCRSGFTKGARKYARNKGIELYNLHDAESRDWRLELTMPLLWIDLHPAAEFLAASTSSRASSSP